MITADSSQRGHYIESLSKLYSTSKLYPTNPPLTKHEVIQSKDSISGRGGFSDCWEGLFLGRFKVAMKCPRVVPADDAVLRRVSVVA